ncbi:MAG: hypothetical protein AB8B82_12715 [Roseovarius sp.]
MEALVAIFAEIIIACMMPFLSLIGALLGALLEGLLLLLAGLFGGVFQVWSDARKAKSDQPKAKAKPRKPLIPRKVVHWAAGIMGTVGVLGVVASFVFFQPILRYVLETASAKAGTEITFESASGTLLAGDVTLEGIHVVREGQDGLTFDLKVERAVADVQVTSLLSRVPVIELAQVEGVSGYVSPPKRDKDKPKEKKPRKPFRANLAQVSDVALEVRPKGGEAYSLVIEAAQVAPFRSGLALFDLLFRSNMQAEIAGQALVVETRLVTDHGRETLWSFENVEAEKIKLLVPRAPLTWLSDGRLTARVQDKWSLSEDYIDMEWLIGFEDMQITVPSEAKTTEKLLGGALAKLVNSRQGNVEFRYDLKLNEQDVNALRAGDLDAFWDTVLSGFLITGGKGMSVTSEGNEAAQEPDIDGSEPGALDKLKGLFKRDEAD